MAMNVQKSVQNVQKLNLNEGNFTGATRTELTTAFNAFRDSPQKDVLVIHFHGGLAGQSTVDDVADHLIDNYEAAGAYPLLVSWQPGVVETLRNNWREIVQNDLFDGLIEYVVQFIVGKLDRTEGERGGPLALPDRFQVREELARLEKGEEPYAERADKLGDFNLDLSEVERDQFERLLQNDINLATAADQLVRSQEEEFGPELKAEVNEARLRLDVGERGPIAAIVVGAGLRIVWRVIKRFTSGRSHGIYPTIAEEVARELKGDFAGKIVWSSLKRNAAKAFEVPAANHRGTALLEEIKRLWQEGRKPRIILVGHSDGAIFALELLKAAKDVLPPDIRFELIFLAPACTFKLFDTVTTLAKNRIAGFRCFGMKDTLEKRDHMLEATGSVIKYIYPRSLLYFISGLLENEVDGPLIGMARFHSGESPFVAEAFPEIKRVQESVSIFPHPWVWSVAQEGPGQITSAKAHAAFIEDQDTLASIQYYIS